MPDDDAASPLPSSSALSSSLSPSSLSSPLSSSSLSSSSLSSYREPARKGAPIAACEPRERLERLEARVTDCATLDIIKRFCVCPTRCASEAAGEAAARMCVSVSCCRAERCPRALFGDNISTPTPYPPLGRGRGYPLPRLPPTQATPSLGRVTAIGYY